MVKVNAIQCPNCKDTIYSRACHDCRHCSCGNIFIDGGLDYYRAGGKYIEESKNVKIKINATKKELWDDWNYGTDNYGLIEENKEKSKCCNANAIVGGNITHYYKCSKCKQGCDVKYILPEKEWKLLNKIINRPAKIISKLKKLLK